MSFIVIKIATLPLDIQYLEKKQAGKNSNRFLVFLADQIPEKAMKTL